MSKAKKVNTGGSKLTAKMVADAIRESRGMISIAARRLNCTRGTVYNWINKSPLVQEARLDAREAMTDTAELKMFEAITKGEPWAVAMYLKTQGKDRGYVERSEQEQVGNVRVEIIRE